MIARGARRIEWTTRRTTDSLRTRYRPACRINHAFLTVAPWLDVLLLGVAAAAMLGSRVIVPGIVADLPGIPFREGFDSDLMLVVNPLPAVAQPANSAAPGDNSRQEELAMEILVFFNDDRFNLTTAAHRTALRNAIAQHMERVGGRDALLYVDRRVHHGDVARLVALLRETGVRRANLAGKPP